MKITLIITSTLLSLLSFSPIANARDYRSNDYDDMESFYNYGPYCEKSEYPKFTFKRSTKLYRTDQFPVATINCRIRKNETQKIDFYNQEGRAYFQYLLNSGKVEFRSLDSRYFYLDDVKKVFFRPENGEIIFDIR